MSKIERTLSLLKIDITLIDKKFFIVSFTEQLGSDFISFLLDLIEAPPDTDLEDQIPDLFVNLILSYNLQFREYRSKRLM